ncbi:terpenoid cyclases/protein prenyltransferase alpha-alpha toroid [Colletotrichum navitas]|uniref:Terpenoid cyclases/protein prenyltransferase alpha-alpha toroid n=1 Tax=Colletotrichum navitas TaxID=681940 RepID=A0AAD8PKC0_9PEZI|nr:terpenoid cyclases/protein prenyltransferase alpha-alpha toroid [Colletotrichum navitas]KAK1566052.1 terpenoid cyclases/protein prenyltransferase alpha-alpha toroid [Colletotrichum navitas]
MSPSTALALASAAKDVIRRLSCISDEKYSFSTASCEPYNTAWVAMVTKTSNGQKKWLFPECFYNLLKTQAEDGSWARHPQTQTTGVLGTAAALLALLKHLKEPLQVYDVSADELRKRVALGTESLRTQLQDWDDAQRTNHIGVELIAPALFAYLEQEDPSMRFQFPARAALQEMYEAKMARFKPEHLYKQKVSTAAHSLEAFIGKIDFDRVSGHLWHGSMMASPSATAVYLMHASVWDDEAEGFLRHVLEAGAGHGDGGVPGTFPTSYFEYSWVVVTLLQGGFSVQDLGPEELGIIADHLECAFKEEGGIIGFAPRAPDADDTAKGLMALHLMGRHVAPDQMIKVFEGRNHFTTFGSERDPSLTSNCHVLLTLLRQPDISQYYPQIIKTANFICEYWWASDGRIRDKWHLSHLYPTMLLAKAFTELSGHLESGALLETAGQQLLWRVRICLFQACLRALLEQDDEDGSWGGFPEQTSYAILTLAEARKSSLFDGIAGEVQAAIDRGARFLETRKIEHRDHGWTSKAAYRVAFVAEAYELAALNVQLLGRKVTDAGRSPTMPSSRPRLEEAYTEILKRTPLFSDMPEWRLRASLLESSLFVPLLRSQRLEVRSGDEVNMTRDRYLDLIALPWVSYNDRSGWFPSTAWQYEMILNSMRHLS